MFYSISILVLFQILKLEANFVHIPYDAQLTKIDNVTSELLSQICGKPTSNQFNAPNGRLYPWSLSVTLFGLNNLGGAIISPLHILTAAHPFLQFNRSPIGTCLINGYKSKAKVEMKKVVVGSDCIHFSQIGFYGFPVCQERHLQTRKIKKVVVDRNFADGRCMKGHDWAILELDKPLNFDENIAPICLPNKNTQIQKSLMAVSFGRPKFYLPSESLIRKIPLKYDPNCTPTVGDYMPTKVDDYLCARSVEPLNRHTKRICHGDSGSGLQQSENNSRVTLVGITSFGSQLCEVDQLTRFTKVSHYIDDICKLTGICYMKNI